MEAIDREPSPSLQPLEYAGRLPTNVRTSRFAIASLIFAVLGSPCLLVSFSNWINWYVPQQFNQLGQYGFVHFWCIRGAMVLATALPVAAIIRISLSRRTRTGMNIAVVALLISLLWWGMSYAVSLIWR